MTQTKKALLSDLDFAKLNGLIPVIVQDYQSAQILMLAFMNQEAFAKTLETGETHFWSRTRTKIWHKGETSGHLQKVKEILVDCDNDSVLIKVEQVGGIACHTGTKSCFNKNLK